ncbi:MAG TPA: hypothetical protein VHK01_13510 [Lacipirellulaceae bacterium]|nr:hypothetical protein [Lacipirellulaceae bacterium]
MTNTRTFRWVFGALVLCAGLAALKSGVAQETTEGNEAREDSRDESALTEEAWENESPRDRKREERGERGRGGEAGRMPGGGGERGYGGYGRGYGEGYGGGYGAPGRGPKPKEMLDPVKIKADALTGLTARLVMMQPQPERMNRIREAAKALVDAEDDDAREDAESNLNEQLDEYFEEDMNRREEELANVERRVKELRELLERRREKKDDIVRLQMEVLQNEANGLGFFSAEGPGGAQLPNAFLWPQGPAAALPQGHPPVQAVPATPYAPGAPAAPAVAPVAAPARR